MLVLLCRCSLGPGLTIGSCSLSGIYICDDGFALSVSDLELLKLHVSSGDKCPCMDRDSAQQRVVQTRGVDVALVRCLGVWEGRHPYIRCAIIYGKKWISV